MVSDWGIFPWVFTYLMGSEEVEDGPGWCEELALWPWRRCEEGARRKNPKQGHCPRTPWWRGESISPFSFFYTTGGRLRSACLSGAPSGAASTSGRRVVFGSCICGGFFPPQSLEYDHHLPIHLSSHIFGSVYVYGRNCWMDSKS